MMDAHRLCIDRRLEGLVVVRQGGKGKCHGPTPQVNATAKNFPRELAGNMIPVSGGVNDNEAR
jgi:hypothetical protein